MLLYFVFALLVGMLVHYKLLVGMLVHYKLAVCLLCLWLDWAFFLFDFGRKFAHWLFWKVGDEIDDRPFKWLFGLSFFVCKCRERRVGRNTRGMERLGE